MISNIVQPKHVDIVIVVVIVIVDIDQMIKKITICKYFYFLN